MSKKVLAKFTPPTKKKADKEEPKEKKSKSEETSTKVKKKSKKDKKSKKSKEHKVAAKVAKKEDKGVEQESEHLHIRISPTLLKYTQKAAEKEDRKHANMVKVILREGLKKRGFNVENV